jgi:hypothetical protein
MSAKQQIEQALGTHGLFKLRLRQAIASGRLETAVLSLGSHEECAFGKWMSSPGVAPATRLTPQFSSVQGLHERFHQAAARVAELAATGHEKEAAASLEKDGEFGLAASEFAAAMTEWMVVLGAKPTMRPSQPVSALGLFALPAQP